MNYEEEQAMLEKKIANLVKVKYKENEVWYALSTLCSDDQLLAFAKHLAEVEQMTNPAKNSESTQQNVATNTYLTTEQFIKVRKSLSDEKCKELCATWHAAYDAIWNDAWNAAWNAARDDARNAIWDYTQNATRNATRNAAWDAAWYATWNADFAIHAKDKVTSEQFEILTKPWTSCGLSLYAEDWEQVLNPKVVEPKNFGAIVEAETVSWVNRRKFVKLVGVAGLTWFNEEQRKYFVWSDLINPTIISEGVE